MRSLPALLALWLLGACAHGGERLDRVAVTEVAMADPWEKTNRQIYALSSRADRYVLRPVTDAYRAAVPIPARRGIRNGYDLLREPTSLANAVAQGKVKSSFRALDRIVINSLLGLGVADHASDMGLVVQKHDFGQTMAVWGVPSGPFLMMPLLGPSTVRDSAGFFVDFLLDPADYLDSRVLSPDQQYVKLGIQILDLRSGLRDRGDQILVGAADEYATVRSAWLQLRRYQIFDGNLPVVDDDLNLPAVDDLDDLPADPPDEADATSAPAPVDPQP